MIGNPTLLMAYMCNFSLASNKVLDDEMLERMWYTLPEAFYETKMYHRVILQDTEGNFLDS